MKPSDTKQKLSLVFLLLLGTIVALELLAPFVSTSFGLDAQYHLTWILQFSELIRDGTLFPRWVSSAFHGFGAATFYFYPPITFYGAAITSAVTGIDSAPVLFHLVSFAATIASFFTSRSLFNTLGSSRRSSTIGALFYTFAPWRIAELYHRSALPTHIAYVFLPLFWIGLLRVGRRDNNRLQSILLLSTATAFLALTNLPFFLVSFICAIVVGFLERERMTSVFILNIALALMLAFCLVSFHYFSALSATPFTAVDDIKMGHAPFHWQDYATPTGLYYLAMTYFPIFALMIAFWKVRRIKSIETSILRSALVISGFVLFLEIPFFSRIIWNNVLPFQLISFNIRFYSQVVFFTCAAFVTAQSKAVSQLIRGIQWFWVLGAIGPALFAVLNVHLVPHANAPLRDADEYRPIYTQTRVEFDRSLESGTLSNMSLEATQPIERSSNFEVEPFNSSSIQTYTFHRFYWPFWHLYVNGVEIPSHPDSLGRAVATLPAGNYTATWKLERTPLEQAGLWISGIAWSGVLLFYGISFTLRRVRKRRDLIPSSTPSP